MKTIRCLSVLLALCLWAGAAAGAEETAAEAFRTVGGYVTFGTYPQEADGSDSTPIEWLVLAYDEAGHRALLLSRYALDARPYNAEFMDMTWEKCTLRAWMNDEFYHRAFSEAEQALILVTEVDNSNKQRYSGWSYSGGADTQDRVFLLSYREAKNYLGVRSNVVEGAVQNKRSRVVPTAYALSRGAYASKYNLSEDGRQAGWWWLRQPGVNQHYAAVVNTDGSLYHYYVHRGYGCVRPALWISVPE